MHAPTIERVGDTVQDVAHTVAERAPDIASAVGRGARSTADTVSDAVTKLAAKTPWVEAPKPAHDRARWLVRAAVVATIAGLVMWFINRRPVRPWYDTADASAAEEDSLTDRRYATAGR